VNRIPDDEAVALNRGDELSVQVEVNVGEVGRGTAVDDNLDRRNEGLAACRYF
jgi:hypothetical protein